MREPVLLDTGPLVAILYQKDSRHDDCVEALRRLTRAPLTCWPVVTEASYLLARAGGPVRELLRMVATREILLAHLDETCANDLSEFMTRYESAGVDLADAALMHLAERENLDTVFTLDLRHFAVYRTATGKVLELLPSR